MKYTSTALVPISRQRQRFLAAAADVTPVNVDVTPATPGGGGAASPASSTTSTSTTTWIIGGAIGLALLVAGYAWYAKAGGKHHVRRLGRRMRR